MKTFDFKDVSLSEGMLKSTLDETMMFYLKLSNDDILKYMREDAGLPSPGSYFSGWYVNSRGTFLIGQWISAFSRMYAISGNGAFREKAIFLMEEFWKCHDILAGTDKALLKPSSHYDYEKLLRAICDLKVYCDYEEAGERLSYLLDFSKKHITRDNIFGDNITEWYTMSEALYLVYETFHIEEAKELAGIWEYREFWDLFYKDQDPFSKRPQAGLYSEFCHAYSHVNSFNGCAMAYKVKKDPYYLLSLRKFYDFMQKEEVMATGGYGPNYEHLMPKNRIIDALRTGHDSFETQCDTYAAFRISQYLSCFTGEARYGHWPETLIYNAVIATIPMTEDGKVIYYSDYNMYGAQKINRQDSWTCCTGTRPLLVAELPRLIYFHNEADLYVSQYTPSVLNWKREDGLVTVRQHTDFPVGDTAKLVINTAVPASFSVKFRMPSWLAGPMTVQTNGTAAEAFVDRLGWLSVEGCWKNGDTITITLPKDVWIHSLDCVKGGPNAFLVGPVALAAVYTGLQTPNDRMNVQGLLEKMRPEAGMPMHYRVEGIDNISFKPFYEFKEHERYFIYHDTTAHATKLHK